MTLMSRSLALLLVLTIGACSDAPPSPEPIPAPAAPPPPVTTAPTQDELEDHEAREYLGPVFGALAGRMYLSCMNSPCIERLSFDGVQVSLPSNFVGAGEIAHVRGTTSGRWSVDVQHTAIGPIEAIDLERGRIDVLGQHVYVLDQTRTRVSLSPDIGAFHVGDFVAVSGSFTADGDIYATHLTHVEPQGLLLRGILAAGHGGGLRIGDLAVDLSAAVLEGFPASAPLPGDAVLVRANEPMSGGRLIASSARLTSAVWNVGGENGAAKILRGFVTASRSPDDFEVGGYRVDLHACDCAPLTTAPAIGTPIEVWPWPGTQPSTPIGLNLPTWRSTVIVGPIDSIDAARGSITVLGSTAQVLPATYVVSSPIPIWELPTPEEELLMRIPTPGSLSELAVGDVVALVGGVRNATIGDARNGQLVAGGVFRMYANASAWLSTSLRVIDAQTIRFLGQEILTDASTRVSDCTYGPCQDHAPNVLFSGARTQYFPPILSIQVNPLARPLRAEAIQIRWQD